MTIALFLSSRKYITSSNRESGNTHGALSQSFMVKDDLTPDRDLTGGRVRPHRSTCTQPQIDRLDTAKEVILFWSYR